MPPSHSPRPQDLVGKVALITGASRGIGHAIALNLSLRGCSILGTCTSPTSIPKISEQLREEVSEIYSVCSQIQPESQRFVGITADIFSHDCHLVISDALAQNFGHVDIVVNSACDPMPNTIGATSLQEIEHSTLGNITTPVLVIDELVRRRLFQKESRIIYISSGRQRQPWSRQLMYSATKAAGEAMCRTWAQAFGGKEEEFEFMAGTTANSIIVGLTETDAVMDCGPEMVKTFQDEFFPLQSIPRFGQPEDVADVVGLLCGHDARWITGQAISASGGGFKVL